MDETAQYETRLHYTLSFIGGFLGVYAILARCDFLGSAQTSNMIYLVTGILGRNFYEVLLRVGAMLLYMTAVALTVYLPKHTKINIQVMSICVTAVAAVILGFLPLDMNPILGLYPIFFATAFQWCSFKGARGFSSSTIFSTNNFRQFTAALTEVVLNQNEEQKDKARFFGGTLVSFHAGVAASFLLWQMFHVHDAWFVVIPAVAAGVQMVRHLAAEKEKGRSNTGKSGQILRAGL